MFVFCKQKTAYEVRISDWSSDVCSSDLHHIHDTDLLVIDAGDPVAPQDTPLAIPGDQTEHGDAAERDADEGDDEDRLMQRQRGEAETAEDRAVGDGKRKAKYGPHKDRPSPWRARSPGAIDPAPAIGCERLGAGGRRP